MSIENTHFGPLVISEYMEKCKSVYFIGIGGINMSSLAHLTHDMGYRTGGSDRTATDLTRRLEGEGISVFYCHDEKNAHSYDVFVYTVAISEDNPEYVFAKSMGKPCISRADYLGYIMTKYKRRVGVSGMHGKSTCTSMCAEILIAADSDPTVLSGAELPAMNGAYTVGKSDNFVFEACEYMDSFLDFNPNIAVILNIEMDHVDYFHSMEQIRSSFARYASLTGKDGYAVYNADDENVALALEKYEGNRISFGIKSDASIMAKNITETRGRYGFDVVYMGEQLCHVQLMVSGYHNIYNALAAAGACLLCGMTPNDVKKGLESFCGACRRMEYKGSLGGADVYDDYGHHPTEIAATLSGAKRLAEKRLFCVYQPHTYSRTAALIDEFAACFGMADRVIFVDIYAAREVNTFGVSSEGLAQLVGDKAVYAKSFEDAARMLRRELREGDVAIVMGAGDVYKTFEYMEFDD
ncbi:MAG: UDP-N-acetylmuramate--L-alanine ligase [Ruminococcaceae bacterium]|nr:UDP-N-acetylmuramate--L-alanine ligase [Oscillospiraceae bacterium]